MVVFQEILTDLILFSQLLLLGTCVWRWYISPWLKRFMEQRLEVERQLQKNLQDLNRRFEAVERERDDQAGSLSNLQQKVELWRKGLSMRKLRVEEAMQLCETQCLQRYQAQRLWTMRYESLSSLKKDFEQELRSSMIKDLQDDGQAMQHFINRLADRL